MEVDSTTDLARGPEQLQQRYSCASTSSESFTLNSRQRGENNLLDQSNDTATSVKSADQMTSAVDAMLQNVDQIILKISDPGNSFESHQDLIKQNGEVRAPYESLCGDLDEIDEMEVDIEPEYVQNYVTFDQSTGKASSIIMQDDKAQFVGKYSFFFLFSLNV